MRIFTIFFLLIFYAPSVYAQIGGDNTYEFINLTSSSRISALGNVLVNALDEDVNLAQQIPSLNHIGMNNQFSINYTNYYAGINFGSVLYGLSSRRFENITIGIKYINYGIFSRMDQYGDVIGDFTAGEYAFYLSGLLLNSNSFRLGTSFKTVYSNLEAYNSFGFLLDLAATYEFRKDYIMGSILIKNAGFQLKKYNHISEPMPFEVVIGLTSRLEHAPLRWSITLSHLEKWNLEDYNSETSFIDPLTNEEILSEISFRDILISHIHLGTEFLLTKNFHLRAGYNFRRRQEMALDLFKHNVGFSWGFGIKIKKFHFNYARSSYHATGPIHIFSVTTNLSQF